MLYAAPFDDDLVGVQLNHQGLDRLPENLKAEGVRTCAVEMELRELEARTPALAQGESGRSLVWWGQLDDLRNFRLDPTRFGLENLMAFKEAFSPST